MDEQNGLLLRIYISERDKHEGLLLSDWIVRKAREVGITGATVVRGVEGFGSHSKIHSTRIIDLSDSLPLIVEIIDTEDKISQLLPIMDEAIQEGLAITLPVAIRKYRSRNPKK